MFGHHLCFPVCALAGSRSHKQSWDLNPITGSSHPNRVLETLRRRLSEGLFHCCLSSLCSLTLTVLCVIGTLCGPTKPSLSHSACAGWSTSNLFQVLWLSDSSATEELQEKMQARREQSPVFVTLPPSLPARLQLAVSLSWKFPCPRGN